MNFNLHSEIKQFSNGFITSWFNSKTDNEIKELALNLLDNYKFCALCNVLSCKVYTTPKRLYSIAKRYSSYFPPEKICKNCIASLASMYKIQKEKEDRVLQGHLTINLNEPDRRNQDGGFTYIFHRSLPSGLYKIGASINPVGRMYSQKFSEADFVCAIESKFPFDLERYLHNLYRQKRPDIRKEMFNLSKEDTEYIRSIKTINNMPVSCYTDFDEFYKNA